MRTLRNRTAAVAACMALVTAGCGSSTDGHQSEARPAPPAAEFPDLGGQSWSKVAKTASKDPQIVISPASSTFEPGEESRFSFGVFDVARTQIPGAEVAMYFADGAGGVHEGPYPARAGRRPTPATPVHTASPVAATGMTAPSKKSASPRPRSMRWT